MNTQKKQFKRWISFVLVCAILMSMLQAPLVAYAQGSDEPQLDPDSFEITTGEKVKEFEDVLESDWFYEAIQYVYQNDLFNGISETEFSPSDTMTRGMFVTVLGRIAGVDTSKYTENSFNDVLADMYYAPYVAWAAEVGITTGTGEGLFSPDISVSREQLATFTVRFMEAMGYEMPENVTDTIPKDMENVSDYAKEFVQRLWSVGLLAGDDLGNFNPLSDANRAEVATISMRVNRHLVDIGVKEDSQSEPAVEEEPVTSGGGGGSSGGGGGSTDDGDDDVISSGFTMNANPGEEMESENPVLAIDKAEENFIFQVKADSQAKLEASLTLSEKGGEEIEYSAESAGSDIFTITPIRKFGNETLNTYQKGVTYSAVLSDETTNFVVDGDEKKSYVRELVIFIKQEEIDTVELSKNLKYIKTSETSGLSEEAFGGLVTTEVDTRSGESTTKNNVVTGTFTYIGSDIEIGDTVSIYGGSVRPDERGLNYQPEVGDDIAYVVITAKNGNEYTYRLADAKEVIFMPDVFPVFTGDDEDKTDGDIITLSALDADFKNLDNYPAELGFNASTTIDEGDFLTLLDTEVTDWDNLDNYDGGYKYAMITNVVSGNTTVTISYRIVTAEEMLEAYVYSGPAVAGAGAELNDDQIASLEADIKTQAIESGFVEEAATYLVALASETESFTKISEDMNLQDYEFDFDTASSDTMSTMLGPPTFVKTPEVTVKFSDKADELTSSDDGYSSSDPAIKGGVILGIKFELKYQITATEYVTIGFYAEFEQQITFDFSTYWGLDWSNDGIIPKVDMHFDVAVDVGTYTSIEIAATAQTFSDDFSWDALTARPGTNIDIGAEINALMQDGGMFEANNNHELVEKYSEFIETTDVRDSYIEVYRHNLARFKFTDPMELFHVIVAADIVLSLNANVSAGITFNHKQRDRFEFKYDSAKPESQRATSTQVAIITPETNFTFYVMGFLGIRAGLELSITAYPLSPSILTSTIGAQSGVYVHTWGFFFYHYNKTGNVVDSRSMGAVYIDLGIYLYIYAVTETLGGLVSIGAPIFYDQWSQAKFGQQVSPIGFSSDFYDDGGYNDEIYMADIVPTDLSATPDNWKDISGIYPEILQVTYVNVATGGLYTPWIQSPFNNFSDNAEPLNPEPYDFKFDNPDFTYDKDEHRIYYKKDIPFSEWDTSVTEVTANATVIYNVPDGNIGSATFTKVVPIIFHLIPVGSAALVFDVEGVTSLHPDYSSNLGNWDIYSVGQSRSSGYYVYRDPNNLSERAVPEEIRNIRPADRIGYEFVGWDDLNDDLGEVAVEIPEKMPTFDKNYRAIWQPVENGVEYAVEYYVNLPIETVKYSYPDNEANHDSEAYYLYQSELYKGTIEENITFTEPDTLDEIFGFVSKDAPAFLEEKLYYSEDGMPIVKVYYDLIQSGRGTITVDGIGHTHDLATDFEIPLIYPKDGYTFDGTFEGNPTATHRVFTQNVNEDGTVSTTFEDKVVEVEQGVTITVFGDATYTPVITPNKDTPYTVKHILDAHRSNDDVVYKTEAKTGETGAAIDTASLKIEIEDFVFDADKSSQNQTISGRGDTEIILVYSQTEDSRGTISWNTGKYNVTPIYQSYNVIEGQGIVQIKCDEGSQHYYGVELAPPTSIVENGYSIEGWYLDEAFTQPVTSWIMPLDDITYYAKITLDNENTGYKVEHYQENLNGEFVIVTADTENLIGETLSTVTATAKTYTGFTFDSDNANNVSSGTVATDGSLVLKQYYSRNEYTVTWNFDNGTNSQVDNYAFEADVVVPANPSKDGFNFGGWMNENESLVNTENLTMGAGHITYKAKWTDLSETQSTIHFVTGGGTSVESYTTDEGADISDYEPTAPTKENFLFDGWLYQGQPYTFTTMPEDDITLTAKWTTSYRIALVGMLADSTEEQEYLGEYMPVVYIELKYDETFQLPTYNGNKGAFAPGEEPTGWIDFNEQDVYRASGSSVTQLTTTHEEDLYFYPTANSYKVYMVLENDEKFSNTSGWEHIYSEYSKTVQIGGTIDLPDADEMTKEGHTFSGWEIVNLEVDHAILNQENNTIQPLFYNTNLTTNEDTGAVTRPWPGDGGSVEINPLWTPN